MNREKLPKSEPETLEMLADVEYTLPFGWGNIYVTKEANEAYELVNLNPDMVSGVPDPGSAAEVNPPVVDIWLKGPGEISAAGVPTPILIGGDGMQPLKATSATEAIAYKDGVVVSTGFMSDKKTLSEQLYKNMRDATHMDEDELEARIEDTMGISGAEMLDKATADLLVHEARAIIENSLNVPLTEWYLQRENSRDLRTLTRLGAFSLGSMGVVFASYDTFDAPVSGQIVGGTILTYTLYRIRGHLRDSYRNGRVLRAGAQAHARGHSRQVADDFHRSFCAADQSMMNPFFPGMHGLEEDEPEDDN